MQFAKSVTEQEHVIVYLATKVTLIMVVNMNVKSIQTVLLSYHVYSLNVLIPVLEHVGFMQFATLRVTSPYVVVHQEQQEIHLYTVESSQLQRHLV